MNHTNNAMQALDAIIAEHGISQFLGMTAAVLSHQAEQDIYPDRAPVQDLAQQVGDLALSDACLAVEGV